MFLPLSFDKEFDTLWMYLIGKYNPKLFDLDGVGKQLDMSKFTDDFFSTNTTTTADVSVDANANVDDISVIAYHHEFPKPFSKIYSYYALWTELKDIYNRTVADKIIEMQLTGDIYINDFHGIGGGLPYCFNYSTYDIMMNGLPMIKKIKSIRPKYLYSFKSQVEQFTIIAANSTLGATGLADMLVVMSHYVDKILKTGTDSHYELFGMDVVISLTDEQKELYKSSKKEIEDKIIGELNLGQRYEYERFGFYSDKFFDCLTQQQTDLIDSMRKELYGKLIETFDDEQRFLFRKNIFRYIEETFRSFIYTINQPTRGNQSCFTNLSIYDRYFLESLKESYIFPDGSELDIELVQKLQELFLQVVNNELSRTPLTFPVLTACFSIDENSEIKDEEFAEFIASYNKEYGQINIYCGESSTLSSCCRLRSERNNEYFNSFGAGSSKIGSLGVCTINLPRLAWKTKGNEERFFDELVDLILVCSQVNNAKRNLVQKRVDGGNHPLYTLGFIDITKQYSTVGINGFNEAIEIMGKDILTKEGQDLGLKIIETINSENDRHTKKLKQPHNCEQIPGEGSSVKLAQKDRLLKWNKKYEIYSNQFIPLVTKADLLDRIKLQGIFDKHFTGGAICHLNVETKIEDEQQIVDLIKLCAKEGIVYFAINYVLAECENGHMCVTRQDSCTICGSKITNYYTRVVGFLTNVRNWHPKRRELDFPNRTFYNGDEI